MEALFGCCQLAEVGVYLEKLQKGVSMKHISFFLLLTILLTSCANATTPTVTASPQPTLTFTPTFTPTVTPTPTQTPDPNMPPDATGKDSKGNYVKEETVVGVKHTFVWKKESVTLGGEEMKIEGWFESHIVDSSDNLNGGIPLVDKALDGSPALMPFYFNAYDDVTGLPYLGHIPNLEDGGKSLSGAVINNLKGKRYKSLNRLDYNKLLYFKGLDVSFVIPSGEVFVWDTNKGYEINVISWDEADPALHKGFIETMDAQGIAGDAKYRFTVFAREDEKLVAYVAFNQPYSELSETELLGGLLNPMGLVIEYEVFPTAKEFSKGWWLGAISDYVLGATTQPSRPYFTYQDHP
jgi:hypothetical protein